VTRLKEAESRIEHEKAYAQGIVETVQHPLIVLDDGLRVISANKAFYEMFQAKPEDTVGQEIYDLGDRQWDIPRLRELLQKIIPTQTAFEDFEVEHEFPQIGRRTVLLAGRRMVGTEGARILLAIEDITERKKNREAIQALNENLERRVTERTALAERRADQLRDLASELTRTEQRERERLAHVLHDDLQQLLVSAQFHLSGLRSQASKAASRTSFEQVEDLIQQSIRASRSLTAELSPTILYEAGLDAALPWLARQMKIKHGIEIRTQINASVQQDEEGMVILLFQAVRELLFNIVKHAAVKEAVVELDRLEDDQVRIVVSDQGAGFDASRLDKGDPPEKGMGLFGICERIKHLGGSVAIDSAPGRGTRVTLIAHVRQPEAEVKTARDMETSALPSPAAAARPRQRRIRVLLVDDHAIVRKGIASILKHERDIKIVGEAADGAQAVEMARQHHPDVIVMDVSMPRMNGIEAARIIHEAQPDIRIIGLSMYEEADRRAEEMRQGATAYLSKGGPPEKLLAAIRAGVRENV
jgi:PAS domain S-box-containing protein